MRQAATVVRKGQIYRFAIDGTEYAAFIWQAGTQFSGRIQGNPHIPECQGRTALGVRDALAALIAKPTV